MKKSESLNKELFGDFQEVKEEIGLGYKYRNCQFKGMIGPAPFEAYNIYGPSYHKVEDRYYVTVYFKPDKSLTIRMTYAKYLMCVELKRILKGSEEVDHKDGDKTNDDLSNLQLMTHKDNNIKRVLQTNSSKLIVDFCCPNPKCRLIFSRWKGQSHISKGGKFTSCSRHCGNIFSYFLRSDKNKEESSMLLNENIQCFRR